MDFNLKIQTSNGTKKQRMSITKVQQFIHCIWAYLFAISMKQFASKQILRKKTDKNDKNIFINYNLFITKRNEE